MTKSQFLVQQDMCPTRITSIILNTNSKNELQKIIRPTSFQNLQMQYPFQSSSRLSVCTFLLYLPCSLYFQGCALHCSSAWWPLVPKFCSWATRESQLVHTNHTLGTLDFTGSEHRAPFNFFQNRALTFDRLFSCGSSYVSLCSSQPQKGQMAE